jgi:hypothetical protein
MWSNLRGTDDSHFTVWLAAAIRIAQLLKLHQIKDDGEQFSGMSACERELGVYDV